MPFMKFPSVESFAHVWKQHSMRFAAPEVMYGSKVKLHGTNAGVRIDPDGTVVAQKRSADITISNDNAGFASWVEPLKEQFAHKRRDVPLVIHGEWAGPGVQRGEAVTQLDRKYFFVFAVQLGDYMITCPKIIERDYVPDLDELIVIPWHNSPCFVDFGDFDAATAFAEEASVSAEKIGEIDPLISDIFGISGPGEGHVYMPLDSVTRTVYSSLVFKVKAERHRVKATSSAASVKHQVPEGTREFVAAFVTPQRVEQAVREVCGGVFDKKNMSAYMKWMGNDVRKESVAELEEMGVEWAQVAKSVNAFAAKAFLERADAL